MGGRKTGLGRKQHGDGSGTFKTRTPMATTGKSGGQSEWHRKPKSKEKEKERTLMRREREKVCMKVQGGGLQKHDRGAMVRIKVDVAGVPAHTWSFPQQPSNSSYGGMGLNRDSVWIGMGDEDFAQRCSKIYKEHVDFRTTGKAFIKSIKRERELAKMPLWRQSLKDKLERQGHNDDDDDDRGRSRHMKRHKHPPDPRPPPHTRPATSGRGEGGGKVRGVEQGPKEASGRAREEDEEGGGTHGQALGNASGKAFKSARERVKERRKRVVGAVEKRVLPKAAVNSALQESAIQAYRQLKKQQAAAAAAAHAKPAPAPARGFALGFGRML